jgi:hypothetical protein
MFILADGMSVIDLAQIRILKEPTAIDDDDDDVNYFSIVCVLSMPANVERRSQMRKEIAENTKLQSILRPLGAIQLVFLLGNTDSDILQDSLDLEMNKHGGKSSLK